MNGVDSSEGLMVWLINYLADQFGARAILKGGMELRLLDCPRHTNDIDYVFVPFASKNDISEPILKALLAVPDLRVTHSINSKCLRCICEYAALKVQIEINVDTHCESQELTTAGLAHANNQQGRIVRAMRLDIALAHKLAAWNERSLIRDLYDSYFMAGPLGVRPHVPTLERRLAKSEIRLSGKSRKVSMSLDGFVMKLRERISTLTQDQVEEHMRDYLPPEELPGLEKKIRVGLLLLLEYLSSQPDPT